MTESRRIDPGTAVAMPTRYGTFAMSYVDSGMPGMPHLLLTIGLGGGGDEVPLVRVHSECLTGDVFGSARCDCGDQLDASLRQIGSRGVGALVYLRQEGRGIGLENKLAAYALQDEGLDTVDANLALGLPADDRDYGVAAALLLAVGIDRCELLTNNPLKGRALVDAGIEVLRERRLLVASESDLVRRYLTTKRDRMGHAIPSFDQ